MPRIKQPMAKETPGSSRVAISCGW